MRVSSSILLILQLFALYMRYGSALALNAFTGNGIGRRIGSCQLMMSASDSQIEYQKLQSLLLLQGTVTQGYQRGSKKLGVPTANLPHFDSLLQVNDMQNGVYFGWGCVDGDTAISPVVANIGKSPTFAGMENPVNIVEAHLLAANPKDTIRTDFYGNVLKLCLVGYLRPEKKFGSFDELKTQIFRDIDNTRALSTSELIDTDSYLVSGRDVGNSFLKSKESAESLAQVYSGEIVQQADSAMAFWAKAAVKTA